MGWGDELMAAGRAERLVAGTNRRVAIMDAARRVREHAAWENNPAIARPDQPYDLELIDGPGHRPYTSGVHSNKWVWKPHEPHPATMHFSEEEKSFANSLMGGFVLIEPHAKAKDERINRDWGFDRFQAVVESLPEVDWLQVGPAGTKLLRGVGFKETANLRLAAAVMSRAKAFVGIEGGLHHTAGALGVPAVVVFGGFISPRVTGYPIHRSLFVGTGLGCGSRQKCQHCQDALSRITPEIVVAELRKILDN